MPTLKFTTDQITHVLHPHVYFCRAGKYSPILGIFLGHTFKELVNVLNLAGPVQASPCVIQVPSSSGSGIAFSHKESLVSFIGFFPVPVLLQLVGLFAGII